jgi:hypothetical protein
VKKGAIIAFLLGWALAVFISPRDVWAMVGGRK